jgi:hypothetical protein
MGKKAKSELVKVIDFTTEEEREKLRKHEKEVEEARERARIKAEQEAEAERKRKEKEALDYRKIMRDINRKKFQDNPPPFKPSRLIDVDSDVAIMNIETVVTSIKETVEHIETMLWDIEEFLFRKDKKKLDSLELKKLKRKKR